MLPKNSSKRVNSPTSIEFTSRTHTLNVSFKFLKKLEMVGIASRMKVELKNVWKNFPCVSITSLTESTSASSNAIVTCNGRQVLATLLPNKIPNFEQI